MNTSFQNQKPGLFTTIALLTLASGIVNLFWGFIASASVLSTLVGIICVPVTILPTILGVFEIVYAAKLLSAQPQPILPSQNIAIFEILTFLMGNIFSMVVGILALIFYNDLSVKNYFARINTTTSVSPAPAPQEEAQEAAPTPLEPVELEEEEEPTKPKRTRKVA